jgi:hypothetical protein
MMEDNMVSEQTVDVVRRGQKLYVEKLQTTLEAAHRDMYVAIEPDSGDYFLGKTLHEAIQASRDAHPDRIAFAMRIGHKAALTIGVLIP